MNNKHHTFRSWFKTSGLMRAVVTHQTEAVNYPLPTGLNRVITEDNP